MKYRGGWRRPLVGVQEPAFSESESASLSPSSARAGARVTPLRQTEPVPLLGPGFPYQLICLDWNGTLVRPLRGQEFPEHEWDVTPKPMCGAVCARLIAAGVTLAVCTNQGGVAFGIYAFDDLAAAIRDQAATWFSIEPARVYICPHHPSGTVVASHCACRKPAPGMLLQAMLDAGVNDPSLVLMVGDRSEDAEAAASAGVAFCEAELFFANVAPMARPWPGQGARTRRAACLTASASALAEEDSEQDEESVNSGPTRAG